MRSALILHAAGERIWRRIEFWPFCDIRERSSDFSARCERRIASPASPIRSPINFTAELLEIRRALYNEYGFDGLIGSGPFHRRLLDQVRLAASSTIPVLIVGEPGRESATSLAPSTSRGQTVSNLWSRLTAKRCRLRSCERELFGGDRLTRSQDAQRLASKRRRPASALTR